MPLILGIESTCDETAASIVEDGTRVRSNVIASQADLHSVYQGVVPEIAARAHIENLLPVLTRACEEAGCRPGDVDAIAVAHRPGLIGSLLVGVTAAKTLAWALGKPLVAVDHVRAHLYSVELGKVGGAMGEDVSAVSRALPLPPGEGGRTSYRSHLPPLHRRPPTADRRPFPPSASSVPAGIPRSTTSVPGPTSR